MNDLMNAPVTFENYQQLALRTEKRFDAPLARLEHAALGLVTETGEAATPIKRVAIYGKSLNDLDKDGQSLRVHLAEEIGDKCWYLAIAADVLRFDFFANVLARQSHTLPVTPATGLPGALKRETLQLSGAVGRFCQGVYDMQEQPVPASFLVQQMDSIGQAITNLCYLADLDLLTLMTDNIAKLRERFPDAYSDEAAEARADKGGLDARNS